MSNTSSSSAIYLLASQLRPPATSPDLGSQTGAMVGVNPSLQQHLALLVFCSHTGPDLQHFQPEEPLLVPEQGLTVSY